MKTTRRTFAAFSLFTLAASFPAAHAQDWPQWRGPNRDAKAAAFTAPKTWPRELTQKWKVTVGEGVSTPSLVGDKLYVFSRQGGSEILRCLDAATGKELWQDKYDSLGATGGAAGFSGPRSSPTVAEGKVVTFGIRGMLSCLDAATGKVLWRKDDFPGTLPTFFTAASPIVAGGLCVAEVGGGNGKGGVVAYDLATGAEKWRWIGDSPAYASPVLMNVGGVQFVIAPTESKVLALALTDGKPVWETAIPQSRSANAATPVIEGQTLITSGPGRGTAAVRLEKEGDVFAAKPLWKNADIAVQFGSPVIKDGFLYGLTGGNELFCLNATDGKTVWTAPVTAPASTPPAPPAENATRPGGPGGPGGGGGRGMRGGGGGGGYGTIVDAGTVLLALTPASQLIAFAPGGTSYNEVARMKVSATPTHAYPVLSGQRIFIKDQDSVTLWTVE
jgi:outer membrane protein assembly factor BamB